MDCVGNVIENQKFMFEDVWLFPWSLSYIGSSGRLVGRTSTKFQTNARQPLPMRSKNRNGTFTRGWGKQVKALQETPLKAPPKNLKIVYKAPRNNALWNHRYCGRPERFAYVLICDYTCLTHFSMFVYVFNMRWQLFNTVLIYHEKT